MTTPDATSHQPAAQPLWRFALIGLGPLGAMLIFALVSELARRLAQ
jgi:hypothetical protein